MYFWNNPLFKTMFRNYFMLLSFVLIALSSCGAEAGQQEATSKAEAATSKTAEADNSAKEMQNSAARLQKKTKQTESEVDELLKDF